MRARFVSSVFVTLLGARTAAAATSLSATRLALTWVNQQAYVANVSINDVPVTLQVGTHNPAVWIACEYSGLPCTPDDGSALYVETTTLLATQAAATLTLGANATLPDFPLRIVQHHNLSDASSVNSLYAPDYSSDQPPLVDGASGVLGFGINSSMVNWTLPTPGALASEVQNFSIYLSREKDGGGSFVDFGGESPLESGEWMVQYKLPLRIESDADSYSAWDVSLVAVRFDANDLLYPRSYLSLDSELYGDAAATLSLNDPLILMPYAFLSRFQSEYLSSCCRGKTATGDSYFSCEPSVVGVLPRIGLYIDTKIFYLDPTDYTHVSSKNASRIIVEIGQGRVETRWVLGAPFLRRFPSLFNLRTQQIDVFCQIGATCRPQSSGMSPKSVESWDISTGSQSSYLPTSAPWTPAVYEEPSTTLSIVLWIGRCFGFLIGFMLVFGAVRSCRRQRGPVRNDDAGTVASEKDLEDAKEELRAMVAAEEAQQQHHATVVEEAGSAYAAIQSPRSFSTIRE